MSQDAMYRWYLETPGEPVPAGRVKELAGLAARPQPAPERPGPDHSSRQEG